MTRVSQSPPNPLSSPVWWLALGTLLINDHVLKTAGVLPGAVTGKLSDFAGLVVAPVLLVALLRAEALAARLACFAAVGAGFGAVKISAAAAAAAAGALGAIGIPSRIIADPTDLIALAVLPAAFLLTSPRPAPAVKSPASTFLERAGLVLGMIACMATSQANTPINSDWQTSSYLLNATGAPLDVRIRFYDGKLDCEALGDRVPRALAPSAFGEGVRFHLEAGHTVPLSQVDVLEAAGDFDNFLDVPSSPCEVALIQSDGMPSAIAWWSNLSDVSVPEVIESTDLDQSAWLREGLVSLTLDKGKLTAAPRGSVKVERASESVEPSSCPAQGESFQWSEVTFGSGELTIVSVDSLLDGCLDIGLSFTNGSGGGGGSGGAGGGGGAGGSGGSDQGADHRITLCVPPNTFPFQAGDTVQVNSFSGAGRSLEFKGATKTFIVRTAHDIASSPLPSDMFLQPMSCDGERMACGGFSLPAAFVLPGSEPIKPGKEAIVDTLNGGKARVVLGRSEQVLAARDTCELTRAALGTKADYIVVIEEGGM
jgi:hypothetical protein